MNDKTLWQQYSELQNRHPLAPPDVPINWRDEVHACEVKEAEIEGTIRGVTWATIFWVFAIAAGLLVARGLH